MKKLSALAVVVLGTAITSYVNSPAIRAMMNREFRDLAGWTSDARREDPAGFVDHVKAKLNDDLSEMQGTKANLASEIVRVTDKKNELQALKSHAQSLAATFRSEWQTQSFPLVVCNAAYTKSQAESQVQLLLDQIAQYEESLGRVSSAESQADERIHSLTLQIDRTKTSLALLDTQKELLKAEKLTSEGEALVAQVDALLNENDAVIAGTPVRSVEELLASGGTATETSARKDRRVAEFLSGGFAEAIPISSDASVVQHETASGKRDTAVSAVKASKPVFSQF